MIILEIYLNRHNISGYNNQGIVAGVIYLTCLKERVPRSQTDIAKAAGISTITLRNRFKEIQRIYLNYQLKENNKVKKIEVS